MNQRSNFRMAGQLRDRDSEVTTAKPHTRSSISQ